MSFWDQQRKGTNFLNNVESLERYQVAKKLGIEVVRLAPNKWFNGRTKNELGYFLIGSDSTNSVPIQKDVHYLKSILDYAHQANIKIALTMLSLPGNRWAQHNQGKKQRDFWESFDAQNTAIRFWTALANQLKDHPALVGYNIKNEPTPERVKPKFKDWYTDDYEAWYTSVKGTPADLNLFYDKIVKSIRTVDANTPIVLDSGFYGTAWAFYSFREDDWEGMDYELGTEKPGWKYWEAIEKGQTPDYSKIKSKPVFDVIQKALNR